MHPSEIRIGQTELSVSELFEMIKIGHIELDTDIKSLKSNGMGMSVESVLLGLTMTPIYVDASDPGKWMVLDGFKRLVALYKFILGKFELAQLEFFPDFNHCGFYDLPKSVQRRFLQSKFTIYSINQGVPPDVRLSLIRRIVPDIKAGLSLKMRESLLSPSSRNLVKQLTDNYIYRLVMNHLKDLNTLELELKYLKTLFAYFREERFIQFNQKAKTEDILILTNKYSGSETDFAFIVKTWEKGLTRVQVLFEELAFKTSSKSPYINKSTFDPLILYFGRVISDEDFNLINLKKEIFLAAWVELFQKGEGIKIFKRKPPHSKIILLENLTKQIVGYDQ